MRDNFFVHCQLKCYMLLRKGEIFYILWQSSVLGRNLTMQLTPLLPPSRKGLPLPFTLAKKETYLDTPLKEEVTNLFGKLPEYGISY